jgi:hypothetical protein
MNPTPAMNILRVGAYVRITGTGGDGLRLRAAPGLTGEPLFLAYDTEIFQIQEGPQDADGYTWWYLSTPYDSDRAGWAASDFLEPVSPPD